MLERVTMPGIELPKLYIAETKNDAEVAMQKGIPFIRWRQGKDKLISMLLLPTLKKLFPYIKWNQVAGIPKIRSVIVEDYSATGVIEDNVIDDDVQVSDNHTNCDSIMPTEDQDIVVPIATDYRCFTNGPCDSHTEIDLAAYVGDMSSNVNLDVLQTLKLMPKFVGDIMDCIKSNVVAGTLWSEGYNKKRNATVGNFDRSKQLKNLIIVDVSASIPVGISATMLTLVDTLRTQVQADLIITGGQSRFYPYENELPSPQEIRNTIPRSNEGQQFYAILRDHIAGNHYGHVISFGDDDNPGWYINQTCNLGGTIVEHVHHYHTYRNNRSTGYALWCEELSNKPIVSYDTSWCNVIRKD